MSTNVSTNNDEGRCEACRRAPIEVVVTDDHQESPYHLCPACERRLRAYALRPLEWFNLAGRYGAGSSGYLDDDFYDEEGTASQPEEEVAEVDKYPAPTLEQVEGDLERLVDYVMTRYFLTPEVVAALGRHPKKAVLLTLEKRVAATPSTVAESTAYEICAQVVGTEAEAWVRQRWEQFRPEILHPLAEASACCLPFEEAFERVTAKLEGLSARELDTHCFALADFRSERTLQWIETHRELARTDT